MHISIPFGKTVLDLEVPDRRLKGVVISRLHELKSSLPETEIVRRSIEAPIGTPRLHELAVGKKRIAVITSDHTRPVPSKTTLPLILDEIRRGAPDAAITIVVASGCHRSMTEEEMRERFGSDVYKREKFLVHDCADDALFTSIGTLPSGVNCMINRAIIDVDLLVAEGFIEPHFFAGYSGGRKAVMPGCASRLTVLGNHCSKFIDSDQARTGILAGNPIHRDMVHAARLAKLSFIVNVVLDSKKRIVASFAGDLVEAHEKACEFHASYGAVEAPPADIVITSNGGYPLDQNIYQAVKSMTAAEACCRPGGVIIVASACSDGHGGEKFIRSFEIAPTPEDLMKAYLARQWDETEPDQWQTQILCRVLMKNRVIMVTGPGAPREMVERLNMRWAPTLDDAMHMADEILGNPEADVTVIPDGVGVTVLKQ